MPMSFVKHESIRLKDSSEFSEKWLQDIIVDDPSTMHGAIRRRSHGHDGDRLRRVA